MSNAFYSNKPLSRLASSTASSRSKSVGKPHVPPEANKRKPDDAKNNNTELSSDKDIKKSSIWSWKGLKALTHVRNRRFNCCFSLSVHSIVGLPIFFNDICLVVHWKRRDGEHTTRPIRVSRGVADFEEQLTHSCSVYGSRSGPHHSAKYEAKHFLLYVSVYDAPELDLGKHRIDLTRLLPIKLEELEDEKSSGKWTTSFRLSGKARGATINVSFGYVVIENTTTNNNNSTETSCEKSAAPGIISLQQNSERTITRNREDVKDLHEVLSMPKSELCDSVNILYQKLDQEMIVNSSVENEFPADSLSSPIDPHTKELFTAPDAGQYTCVTGRETTEFFVIDKGIVELSKENAKQENESFDNAKQEDESFKNAQVHGFGDGVEAGIAVKVALDEEASPRALGVPQNDDQLKNTSNYENQENEMCSKESIMKELEEALSCTSNLVNEEVDSQEDETDDAINPESYLEVRRKGKSLILDDDTELVARDFLEMLGIEEGHNSPINLSSESEPESPRERLLREFEKDALANGGLLNFDIDYDPSMFEDFGEMFNIETDNAFGDNKTRALRMEDLETEALMREWGLNEKAFQHSPSSSGCGFGSPIDDILPEEPQPLPPLAEGLGPFVQTQNGGFVRSMNPVLFQNAKNGGSLIMQVSNPVVVPAEMGSGVMDILQGLASVGIEKLSMQANKLMPLEDVTGKTIQQIAWESAQSLEGSERQDLPPQESEFLRNMGNEQKCEEKGISHVGHVPKSNKFNSSSLSSDAEYVNLEDLAPLAMDKIEALSIEGLRIQSGMCDGNAPSNISAQSIGEFSALKGKTVDVGGSIGLDGTCGLQLLDIKDNDGPPEEDVDGLMGLSLTLDEWMKLDSGEIDEDELVSERTSKILAAHRATSLDVFRGRSKGEKRRGRGKKYGLLGNNFTVALMVQLRDPLRNYEAVGAPMLALIQVERVFVPPKPRIYSTVSMVRGSKEDDENEDVIEKPKEDEKIHEVQQEEVINIPQYKITDVHVAGLKMEEEGKKKLWGTSNQQQSGSRWLLANGMGKKNNINNKNPLLKSKAVGKSSLWSINGKGR
ncbi:hypothetical protein PHJA_000087400 [Phtheirospermum japonicum]|uniref:C2 NT-type domain-containing protein n=1 Tax=Phtheirospermum japonicum TaxID=374723 RepID=A0A830B264_9LAMI|nr:hypothetical protein PHJA_000087400 [Phtheirospermum japonicum]